MFTDRVILEIRAGKGGNGVVAWRRERHLAKGGPYGGDGGRGGSVFLEVETQLSSLESFRNQRIIKAESGGQGGANNRHGKKGRDRILKVPCGTLVKKVETGEVLHDLTVHRQQILLCRGGRGGKGNTYFKSPTNRAPNTATPGKMGERGQIELELKLIADVGLVGFPNAGKSTLIAKMAHRSVKIAPYPFTTLHPNLGYAGSTLIADIPGIIAGASQNRGLGLEFLRHIERTSLLLFIIDSSALEGREPMQDFKTLRSELGEYNPELLKKPFAIVLNKVDVDCTVKQAPLFQEAFPYPLFEISALTGQGVEGLVNFLKRKLNK